MNVKPDQFLYELFLTAVKTAKPANCLPKHLPEPPKGRTLVIGAGKASASMAQVVESHWQSPLSGLVVTPYGHSVACQYIEVIEAANPVPDITGHQAASRILDSVQNLNEDDLVICLISGGGSALLAIPAQGVSLEDKQIINKALLRSGANIEEINCVRKHISAIKGGRLAAACSPARIITLLISDVPGDDPAIIASGPTVADHTYFADALAVLDKYAIHKPAKIYDFMRRAKDETPKPGDPRLTRTENIVLTTSRDALEAAALVAKTAGITPFILNNNIDGESREAALDHAKIVQQIVREGKPVAPPCVLLSGGETTVTVRGNGRGGRNAEFLLALAIAFDSQPKIYAIACDTDGIDGTEDNAGCLLYPDTLSRAEQKGINAKAYLEDNDAYTFFFALDSLVITGPTRTNVNDFRAILIENKTK